LDYKDEQEAEIANVLIVGIKLEPLIEKNTFISFFLACFRSGDDDDDPNYGYCYRW
jgi:hypothetical protein